VANIIRTIELEDAASPRRAQYAIRIRQLTEGYSVEICWGCMTGKKAHESYYRETLAAALEKFERVLASKKAARRRRYWLTGDAEQPMLIGFSA